MEEGIALNIKSRVWTVSDFATFTNQPHRTALRLLKQLDARLGGMLLRASLGKKPEYTLFPGQLAQLAPEFMADWQNHDTRLTGVEDRLYQLEGAHRRLAAQTAANTRDVAALRTRKSRAA